jgi:hypothetical protein
VFGSNACTAVSCILLKQTRRDVIVSVMGGCLKLGHGTNQKKQKEGLMAQIKFYEVYKIDIFTFIFSKT